MRSLYDKESTRDWLDQILKCILPFKKHLSLPRYAMPGEAVSDGSVVNTYFLNVVAVLSFLS